MIRRALLAAVFLAVAASPVVAIAHLEFSTPLEIWVDPDGSAFLYNTTGAPISFDGYQIASETNQLDPAGWKSIADQVAADPVGMIGKLGAGALSFGEANPNAGNLAELNVAGVATLGAGVKFPIGKPFLPNADHFTTAFYYKVGGNPNSIEGAIGPTTPEPSAFLLAALAGVGLLAFQRRGATALRRDCD